MNILKNDLENFSVGSSNENWEEDLIKEVYNVDINKNKEKGEVNNETLGENNIVEEDSLNKTYKQEKVINKVEEIEHNFIKKQDDSIFFGRKGI